MRFRRRGDETRPPEPAPSEPFPEFAYHPDPRGTGSVIVSSADCVACGRARGYVYRGQTYAEEELADALCPWCIADGSAAERFDADFTDVDTDVPDDVPDTVLDEIAHRTPGFTGWQQEHWLYHCGDGAAFLGLVGSVELGSYPDALDELRRELDESGWSRVDAEGYLNALDKEGEPTAYLFRCRHCGRHLAYSDFT